MQTQIIFFSSVILSVFCSNEVYVLNSISEHIGNVVLQCKNEMGFKRDIIKEFLSFWNPLHELQGQYLGCAIACVLKNLEMIQRGGQLKKNNAIAFLNANGSDPETSSKLIELFNICMQAVLTKKPTDGCVLGLELSKCFRYGIFKLHWAPAVGAIYQEEMPT